MRIPSLSFPLTCVKEGLLTTASFPPDCPAQILPTPATYTLHRRKGVKKSLTTNFRYFLVSVLSERIRKKKGKRLGRKSYQSSFTHERSGATQYIHLYVMPFISWSDCTYIDINEISSLLLEKKNPFLAIFVLSRMINSSRVFAYRSKKRKKEIFVYLGPCAKGY